MSPGKVPPAAGSTRGGPKAIYPNLLRLASRAHFEAGGANKEAGSSPASSYPRAPYRERTSRLGERFLPKLGPAYLPVRTPILLMLAGPRHAHFNNSRSAALHDNLVVDKLRPAAGIFHPVLAVARRAGWLAHAMEQQKTGCLIRPSSAHIGPVPASAGSA